MYALHARRLLSASKAQKAREIDDLLQKLRSRIPPLAEFKEKFAQLRYSDSFPKQKKLVQYILRKDAEHISSGVALDFPAMTIEHIAPQSSTSVGDQSVASIGNLILVEASFNSSVLANKSFLAKKNALEQSNVSLDEILISASAWGEHAISNRSASMAERAYTDIFKF